MTNFQHSEDVFFFDFLSPYSFLGWMKMQQQLQHSTDPVLRERLENIVLCPIPMGSLIHSYETKGPAEIAPKRDYLMRAWLRECERLNLNIQVLPKLPFNSLYALRLSCSGSFERAMEGEDLSRSSQRRRELIDRLFKKCWLEGEDIACEENLQKWLLELELPVGLLEQMTERQTRAEIKQNLKLAKQHQAFGVPSWSLKEGELFWGQDSFGDMLDFIQGRDQLNRELYKCFLSSFE